MQKPLIHLNGSARKHLQEVNVEAHSAIQKALGKLCQAAPNDRDYYPLGPAACDAARREHEARCGKLGEVLKELQEMVDHLYTCDGWDRKTAGSCPPRPSQGGRVGPLEAPMYQIQAFESIDPAGLPPDLLAAYVEGRDTAWRIVIKDQAQRVLVLKTPGRAGVAWGGDATWIDLREDEGAEDAALIVLCQPDETERRR